MNGTIVDVQEIERTREGVTIRINDERHSGMIDFVCVSTRTL